MTLDRKIIFDAVREIVLERDPGSGGFSQSEVEKLDLAITTALGATVTRTLTKADAFYAGVRPILGGHIQNEQFDIIERLLKAAAHWTTGWLAYGLATAWHEARLMPIEEIGKGRGRPYGKPDGTGQIPYGRGLVQITWAKNYSTIDEALGLGGKLVADYRLALDPDIAVRALVVGMERGLYTGKSLATYIAPGLGTHAEFVKARRIINGTDRQDLIATYADRFKDALIAGGWG